MKIKELMAKHVNAPVNRIMAKKIRAYKTSYIFRQRKY